MKTITETKLCRFSNHFRFFEGGDYEGVLCTDYTEKEFPSIVGVNLVKVTAARSAFKGSKKFKFHKSYANNVWMWDGKKWAIMYPNFYKIVEPIITKANVDTIVYIKVEPFKGDDKDN